MNDIEQRALGIVEVIVRGFGRSLASGRDVVQSAELALEEVLPLIPDFLVAEFNDIKPTLVKLLTEKATGADAGVSGTDTAEATKGAELVISGDAKPEN